MIDLRPEDALGHVVRAGVLPVGHVTDLAPGANRTPLGLQPHLEDVLGLGILGGSASGREARSANSRLSLGIMVEFVEPRHHRLEMGAVLEARVLGEPDVTDP